MNITITDFMILNNCTITIPICDSEHHRLHGSGTGEIIFHVCDRSLILDSITFFDNSDLDQMLEALARFAFLIHAKCICCDTTIPLCTIAYLDSHGILDHDYALNE